MARHAGGPSGSTSSSRRTPRFHDAIFAAAGNRKLREMYRQLLGQMGRYRMRSVSLRGSLQRSVLEHRAVARGGRGAATPSAAARLLAEHIRVPQLRLQELERR